MKLVTAAEMRELDRQTIEEVGVPGAVLMESAGRGVVEVIAGLSPVGERRIAVVAGPGNNGGDGFVIARHLANRGARVEVILVAERARVGGDARVHLEAAVKSEVVVRDGTAAGFPAAAGAIDRAEVVVDALLGTGTARAVGGHLAEVIERMNAAPGVRVAVDLPSGLDADSGWPLGVCVRAHHTVTFGWPKLGLATAPGFVYAGELHVVDIGIPPSRAAAVKRTLLDDRCLGPLATPRDPLAHKGTHGHVVIVAGSAGRTGAALLAAEACARAGAGLTTIAAPDGARAALEQRVVEVMTAGLGPEPLDGAAAWAHLVPLLAGKRAVAFGPGVARDEGTRALLERLLVEWQGPLVIDADGLNHLAQDPAPLEATRAQVIVTPHPAEMGRLSGTSTEAVQADRVEAAEGFARQHGVVVVLKGARTVIAAPDGRTAICPTGGPALGSGGTGDVLTGAIAALAAAGMGAWEAACAGVYLHGRAGDLAAAAQGDAGVLARDVVALLPRARRP
jgi:hydroxyethylthiazole kinase-like uncharacterized protein yjeF